MKIIRCPKPSPNQVFEDVKYPWNIEGYEPFRTHWISQQNKIVLKKNMRKVDSGWGDRLLWWSKCYSMSQTIGSECLMQFEYEDYPESDIFKFPGTEFIHTNEFYKGINNFEYLEDSQYELISVLSINNQKYPSPDNLPENIIFGQCSFIGLDVDGGHEDIFKLIKFVHPKLESVLRKYFNRFTVVHVRRWHGIRYFDDSVMNHLGNELKNKYMQDLEGWERISKLSKNEKLEEPWLYFDDDTFFNALKDVEGPIYIATDLPKEYYKDQWIKQYGKRLYDQDNVIHHIQKIFSLCYDEEWMKCNGWTTQGQVERLVDYFAMMFAKELHVLVPEQYPVLSAFSDTARLIGGTKCKVHRIETVYN